jgi:diphthine methyl ester synthase
MIQKETLVRVCFLIDIRFTNNLVTSKENFYGKELIVADRDLVETGSDEILKGAEKENVSLLVVGDPFG